MGINKTLYIITATIHLFFTPTHPILTPNRHHPRYLRHHQQQQPPFPHQTDWESGLREAAYRALSHRRPSRRLHDDLAAAPIVDNNHNDDQQQPVPFGDVTVLARGRLYRAEDGFGGFRFVREPYRNDCEECHDGVGWDYGGGVSGVEGGEVAAVWTVRRIRHRDQLLGHRYELEYVVVPSAPSVSAELNHYYKDTPAQHNDYRLQQFDDGYSYNVNHYPEVNNENRILWNQRPTPNAFQPSQQTFTLTTTRDVRDNQEIQLYKQLIDTLSQKTERPTQPTYHSDIFDIKPQTTAFTTTTSAPTIKMTTFIFDLTKESTPITVQPTTPKYNHKSSTTNANVVVTPAFTGKLNLIPGKKLTTVTYFTPVEGEEVKVKPDKSVEGSSEVDDIFGFEAMKHVTGEKVSESTERVMVTQVMERGKGVGGGDSVQLSTNDDRKAVSYGSTTEMTTAKSVITTTAEDVSTTVDVDLELFGESISTTEAYVARTTTKKLKPTVVSIVAKPIIGSTLSEPKVSSVAAKPTVNSIVTEPTIGSTVLKPKISSVVPKPTISSIVSKSRIGSTVPKPTTASTTPKPMIASVIPTASTASTIQVTEKEDTTSVTETSEILNITEPTTIKLEQTTQLPVEDTTTKPTTTNLPETTSQQTEITDLMQIKVSSATEPIKTTTETTKQSTTIKLPKTTPDNFLLDIFGEKQQTKPMTTTERNIKTVEFEDFLFNNQQQTQPTPKIIFENFFEASTASNEATIATTEEPLATPQHTEQSYITSTSMKINRQIIKMRSSTTAMPSIREQEKNYTQNGDRKAAFDQVALTLVNHARAVDLLHNTNRRRKYVRSRVYKQPS